MITDGGRASIHLYRAMIRNNEMATKMKVRTAPQPVINAPQPPVMIEEGKMALFSTGDEVPEYLQGTSRGNENVTMEDIAIPRLEIVQGLSPAMKRGDAGYLEDARLGDLVNSATNELYGDSVYVVPVHFSVQYLIWKQRKYVNRNGIEVNTEGGFLGAFQTAHEAKARASEEGGEEAGIEVVDTPQHLCLLVNKGGLAEEIIVSMPRTKAKISRQWNTLVKIAGHDRFSRLYRLSTDLEKNARGDYYNYSIKLMGFVNKAMFTEAEALYKVVSNGDKQVVMSTAGLNPVTTDTFDEYTEM